MKLLKSLAKVRWALFLGVMRLLKTWVATSHSISLSIILTIMAKQLIGFEQTIFMAFMTQ
ncbi:hypothetical protein DJ013_10015 [Arcticibacterium luteifluviistationis]|uniref:Uncharacterized protein n=1 Tax=Arcticibacterium luteifluviistationis TaxID=1784714 RepID=A0A2Z4GBP4_9BACT|nr:hypothetical protein DJ013_10015 [Arcticibacterium luteifluviistationis]